MRVLLAFLLPTVLCLGEHKLKRNQTNAFKVFDIFADGVAVYTSSDDPSLQCVTAYRTEYEPNKKVVYTWHLHHEEGSNKDTYVVEYHPGPTEDTVVAISDNDEKHSTLVKFDYTNNKNCVVANFPYKGEVCILWVPKADASSVPQECVDQFEDICDVKVPGYQEELCDRECRVWASTGCTAIRSTHSRGTYKIEFRPGPTPDTAVAITNDDNFRPHLVKFQYTNNKNCNIAANFPYHGDVCVLWVTGSSRFSVPQECIDHFEDICDAEVPDYDEGICGNDL
ncbi:hypothetical protein HPB50_027172 [Hyalomma asiaticum]|uniref:Uncharacterized protein n=1 Tax=Hyalomma asiaticum TaxID=266040 RepID=A0ACB7RRK8_HYAAI|nr:hypothetical protein HPB50_027172 [Hyalomma asiaticum]